MTFDFKKVKGSVWWARLNGYNSSSVQKGTRPVVIVSSLAGCVSTDLVMIVPLTTKKKGLTVEAELDFECTTGVKSYALGNQIQTVPNYTLETHIGELSEDDLHKIESVILISLGIAPSFVKQTKVTAEEQKQLRDDRETLEKLIPSAKELIKQMIDITQKYAERSDMYKSLPKNRDIIRRRRTPEEIEKFMRDWTNPFKDRADVISTYEFANYSAAYQFYRFYKKKQEAQK